MSDWGKAELLFRLRGQLANATILESHFLDQAAFYECFDDWWRQSPGWMKRHHLAVRSDHDDEGALAARHAGKYLSVLDVPPRPDAVREAAASVFATYDGPGNVGRLFIQPMAPDVRWSGVITSRNRRSGAPYFVIHEAPGTDTSRVTSGGPGESQVTYIARSVPGRQTLSRRHEQLLRMTREVEALLDHEQLELEFVTHHQALPVLLQARPLDCPRPGPGETFSTGLERLNREADAWWSSAECGDDGPVFSVMADWNPAEIIGRNPKPLATSLYQVFVTNRVWAQARADLGYHEVRLRPLMRILGNTPYVDVSLSLRSLTPAGIDERSRAKLVRHWLAQLRRQPGLHDAIELEIAETCYTTLSPVRVSMLREAGLSPAEIEDFHDQLKSLTRRLVDPAGLFHKDLETLRKRLRAEVAPNSAAHPEPGSISALASECIKTARLFARLARSAFVGVAQLEALVKSGAVDENDRLAFYRFRHPAMNDHHEHAGSDPQPGGTLHLHDFLRPGTYDIERSCYRDMDWHSFPGVKPSTKAGDSLPRLDTRAIQDALDVADTGLVANDLSRFISLSIAAREESKFLYSYHLSRLLEAIAGAGQSTGLSRAQLAMLDIAKLMNLPGASIDQVRSLAQQAEDRRARFNALSNYVLPDVLVSPLEVFAHTQSRPDGHFFGHGVVSGTPIAIDEACPGDLRGRVVVLEAADPGFEFLFGSEIAALVTCYGGVNSHMAVRCQESGTPGVLGVGPDRFDQLLRADQVTIDFDSRRLIPESHQER